MPRTDKETALAFYNNTYEADQKQYLSLISQDPNFTEIRKEYFRLFDWNRDDLLDSLRILTSKLFFKGESQHIDTILQSFAESWYTEENSKSILPNTNAVYLTSYSLILLNTDLHTQDTTSALDRTNLEATNSLTKRKRITQQEFVTNTLNALNSNDISIQDRTKLEQELKNYYDNLLANELKLSGINHTKHDDTASVFSNGSQTIQSPPMRSFGFASALASERSMSGAGGASSSGVTSSGVSMTTSNTNNMGLRKQYSRESLGSSTAYTMRTSSNLSNLNEMDNESELISMQPQAQQDQHLLQQDFQTILEEEGDLELELEGPPWIKEGLANVVIIDIEQDPMLNSRSQSKFNFLKSSRSALGAGSATPSAASIQHYQQELQFTRWRNVFIVIAKGELRMFSFESNSGNKRSRLHFGRHNSNSNGVVMGNAASNGSSSELFVGAGNWYDNAQCLAVFALSQTYASKPTEATFQTIRTAVRNVPAKPMGEAYWSLTLPLQQANSKKHTKLVVQCGSDEIAREFIESCNFWAARTSNIPSDVQTVSSFDYGWSRRINGLLDSLMAKDSKASKKDRKQIIADLNSIKITDWSPLATSNLPTNLVMTEQLSKLQSYNKALKEQLKEHEAFKPKLNHLIQLQKDLKIAAAISGGDSGTSEHSTGFSFRRRQPTANTRSNISKETLTIHVKMISTNYNKKANYLNREILKHRKYLNSLQNAIKLRHEKLKEQAELEAEQQQDLTEDFHSVGTTAAATETDGDTTAVNNNNSSSTRDIVPSSDNTAIAVTTSTTITDSTNDNEIKKTTTATDDDETDDDYSAFGITKRIIKIGFQD